jgi:hypothetical protein
MPIMLDFVHNFNRGANQIVRLNLLIMINTMLQEGIITIPDQIKQGFEKKFSYLD